MAYFVQNNQVKHVLYKLWEDAYDSKQKNVPNLEIDSKKQYSKWYYDNSGVILVYNGYTLKGTIFKSAEHYTWFMLNYS